MTPRFWPSPSPVERLRRKDLHIILNMSEQDVESQLPDIPQRQWHLALDTAAQSLDDIIERVRQRAVDGNIQKAQARSVVVFEAREIKSSTSSATQLPEY